jgi:hypothetical protein
MGFELDMADYDALLRTEDPPTVVGQSDVTISRNEYDALKLAAAKLDALHAHGVADWAGYCYAMSEMYGNEEYGSGS